MYFTDPKQFVDVLGTVKSITIPAQRLTQAFRSGEPPVRQIYRVLLLAAVLGFAILVLGFGLNWLYDPNRGR
jgi:hypothetical protein